MLTRATPVVSDAVTIMRGQPSLSSAPISSPDRCRYCVVHPSEEPSPRTADRVYVKFGALHVVLGISPARGGVGQTPCTGPEKFHLSYFPSWVGWRGVARPVEVEGGSDGLARVTPISGCARQAPSLSRLWISARCGQHGTLVQSMSPGGARSAPHTTDGPARQFLRDQRVSCGLRQQHIGKVFRAYRNHPRHLQLFGKALNQELLGRWLGLTQAQVSKVENGKPEQNLEALRNYADALHLPQRMLWFDLPGQSRLRVLSSAGSSQADESRAIRAIGQCAVCRVVRSPSLGLGGRGTSSKLRRRALHDSLSRRDKCCESRGLGGDCTSVCRRGEGSRTIAHAR